MNGKSFRRTEAPSQEMMILHFCGQLDRVAASGQSRTLNCFGKPAEGLCTVKRNVFGPKIRRETLIDRIGPSLALSSKAL